MKKANEMRELANGYEERRKNKILNSNFFKVTLQDIETHIETVAEMGELNCRFCPEMLINEFGNEYTTTELVDWVAEVIREFDYGVKITNDKLIISW